MQPYARQIRLAFTSFSIVANAICAGGIFCFPLISPTLVTHLKLTQPQLTTIALAGFAGQYPFSALIGKMIDCYGPWLCSLLAACMFSTSFWLFAQEMATAIDAVTVPATFSYRKLALYFFISAVGSVFSYFSSLFAASKNFPSYIGAATGISIALFGLSPMFLSAIASHYFSHPDTGLDVISFLRFLAIFCGFIHLVGAITMRAQPAVPPVQPTPGTDPEDPSEPNERTSLLSNKTNSNVMTQIEPATNEVFRSQSALDVLKDLNFWLLAFVAFVILGSCEMVISNIGTIVLSLPTNEFPQVEIPNSDAITSMQVRAISLTNTLSRLIVGLLADVVSPVVSHPFGDGSASRKHIVSRVVFLTFSSFVFLCTCLWMIIGVRSQGAVLALSIGGGIVYGCTFSVLPSLVAIVWGSQNQGRNFGMLTYATLFGTIIFSYFYAFIATAHAPADGSLCTGVQCWHMTFETIAAATVIAAAATIWLWRRWQGKV